MLICQKPFSPFARFSSVESPFLRRFLPLELLIEELSYLLGVKISDKSRIKLYEKYRGNHTKYWESRRLIQRSLDDWIDDNPFLHNSGLSFRLMPKLE